MKLKNLPIGSKKIKSTDLKLYEKQRFFWKKYSNINQSSKDVYRLYEIYNRLHYICDEENSDFIKGHLTYDMKITGSRIKFLPNGKKIARGGFSIFSKHLTINTSTNFAWDVCYQNTSGTKTYLYSEEKVHLEQITKYKIVQSFKKNYKKIISKLQKDLIEKETIDYLALYTLIFTLIRVGNYDYYLVSGHKGLTTLQKKDIMILDETRVIFDFIGKDGVLQHIEKEFPKFYVDILKNRLKSIKKEDFVFADEKKVPLHSSRFSTILHRYTGEHYYPHIIRSYFADTNVENFIKNAKRRKKLEKKDINNKLLDIANNLGHKKFNKKTGNWEPNYTVTIASYIYPPLLEEMKELV